MALIAWYRLDGNANDELGRNNGNESNLVWTVFGLLGRAADFNATNSEINCGNSTDFNIRKNISISFWTKVRSHTDFDRYVWKTHTSHSGTDSCYGMSLFDDGKWRFALGANMLFSSQNVILDRWEMLTGTYDGQMMRLYRNGILDTEMPRTELIAVSNQDLMIGRTKHNTSYIYPANAIIDDVRLYDHALSAAEVWDLSKAKIVHHKGNIPENMDNNFVRDYSGQDNHTTLTLSTTPPVYSPISRFGTGSWEFSGGICQIVHNDFYGTNKKNFRGSVSNTHWNGSCTYSAWVRPTELSSNDHLIFTDTNLGEGEVAVRPNGFYTRFAAGNEIFVEATVNINEWYHILISHEEDISANLYRLKFYVNGELIGSSSTSRSGAAHTYGPDGLIRIGRGFIGQIDDIRIYATAFDDNDVKRLYRTRFILDDKGNLYA